MAQPTLNLPSFSFNIRTEQGKEQIYDMLRKRFVALTPEEWVRQNFVRYLVEYKGYPPALMANEIQINLKEMARRCDSVVFDKQLIPRVILEYKRPAVEITNAVFAQISRYNMVMKVDYLIISNGLQHFCCKMNYDTNTCDFLSEIPDYCSIL